MKKISSNKSLKLGLFFTIFAIIVLTVLEFPAPIGFEVRPQDNVSSTWLFLFLAIVVSEIAAMILVFMKPKTAGKLGIIAGSLNIVQIIADQAHLMQPEIAPIGYLLLEDIVGVASIFLVYLSLRLIKSQNK